MTRAFDEAHINHASLGVAGAVVTVCTATADDAQLLSELGARTFRDTFAEDNTASDMAAYLASAFSVEIQGREVADPATTFLLAEVAGQAVGYARLRAGDAPVCVSGERPIEIVRLYADARWIGAGIGLALMRACLAEATVRARDVVWLDVWELNPRAIAFYSKWGFAVVGRQEFVLGEDIQHDLLMARPADWDTERISDATR